MVKPAKGKEPETLAQEVAAEKEIQRHERVLGGFNATSGREVPATK